MKKEKGFDMKEIKASHIVQQIEDICYLEIVPKYKITLIKETIEDWREI